jgi:hypothetical protein
VISVVLIADVDVLARLVRRSLDRAVALDG